MRLGLALVDALLERDRPGQGGLTPDSVTLSDVEGALKATLSTPPTVPPSPALEAPERGGALDAAPTASTDLYEVGLLLFWALTGRPAFETGTPAEVWDRQLSSPLHPLPAGLPRPLRALVKRLLQPDPRDRYHSYQGLQHDLRTLEGGRLDFCIGANDLRTALALPDYSGGSDEIAELLASVLERGMLNLVGVSGSGKSRLLAELGELARSSDWVVLSLRGEPLSGTLAESVAGLLEHCGTLEPCRPAAQAVASLLQELTRCDSRSSGLQNLSESLVEARLEELFSSLPLGHGGPVMLLVDDAQWLAASLLRALAHARQKGNLAVVTAGRVQSTESADQTLDGLAEDTLRELLASMAGPLPESVLQSLVSGSGGSPFLAVEGLRGWVESGRLSASPQGWREAGAPTPASRRAGALLAQRLDLLSPLQERVLTGAAVLGRTVDPVATAELTGESSTEVREAIASALDQRLLWLAEGGALTFCHDRIREELEARLPSRVRRELHQAAALRAERCSPHEPLPQAHHFPEPSFISGRCDRRWKPVEPLAGPAIFSWPNGVTGWSCWASRNIRPDVSSPKFWWGEGATWRKPGACSTIRWRLAEARGSARSSTRGWPISSIAATSRRRL